MNGKFYSKVIICFIVFLMTSVAYANQSYYLTDSGFKIYPVENVDWWNGDAKFLHTDGEIYDIFDIDSRLTFKVRRRWGGKHIDFEPLTAKDTEVMCRIYGVSSSEQITDKLPKRPCLLTYGERTIACSMFGNPHGPGDQQIFNNNFDGVGCLHFLNSQKHNTGTLDEIHQNNVQIAYNYGLKYPPNTSSEESSDKPTETTPGKDEESVIGRLEIVNGPVNVRTGPGLSYTSLRQVQTKEQYNYTKIGKDTSNRNWYKIIIPNSVTGWVLGSYTKEVTATDDKPSQIETPPQTSVVGKVQVINGDVNVRTGPGTTYTRIDTLKVGAQVDYKKTEKNGDVTWYSIVMSNGKEGWIHGGYVKIINGDSGSSTDTPSSDKPTETTPGKDEESVIGRLEIVNGPVNVRTGPGLSYTSLRQVQTKEQYNYTKIGKDTSNRNWYKIIIPNSVTGWVLGSYTKEVTATDDKPSQIETPPQTSVVGKVQVINGDVNVRTGPGTTYTRIDTLKVGAQVDYKKTEKNGDVTWYSIVMSNGKEGWIHGGYVKIINGDSGTSTDTPAERPEIPPEYKDRIVGKLEVINGPVNIRKGPHFDYEIIEKVENGEMVYYLGTETTMGLLWYNVITPGGKLGWLRGDFYAKKVGMDEGKVVGKIQIINSAVSVRKGPSSNFDKVGTLQIGDTADYIKYETYSNIKWYQVVLANAKKGWIHGGFIKVLK